MPLSSLAVPSSTHRRSTSSFVGEKAELEREREGEEDSTVTMELMTRRSRTSLVNSSTGNGNEEVPAEITMSAPGSPNHCKLRDRTILSEEKRRLCGWALGIALSGIVLMILQTELCWFVCGKDSVSVFIISLLISLSTVCLLGLVVAFHYKDIRMFMIDHSVEDWRIALTARRIFSISLELVVCALHPVPLAWLPGSREEGVDGDGEGFRRRGWNSTLPPAPACSLPVWELLLSSVMFLRLYLVPRSLLLYSKIHQSASYRSIGSLNNINFHFKLLMNTQPGLTLLAFIVFLWLTASWILTLCERQSEGAVGSMEDTVWLVAITFLTIGYGDLTPKTTCGKTVCLLTGVMGVGCTAMLVAVVSNKLALNKAEKHVHQFMMDTKYTKKIRNAAANVLRECWLLHRSSRGKRHGNEHRRDQRRLLKAIQVFRNARLKQRKKTDHGNKKVDLLKHLQRITCDLNANWSNSYKELEQRINSMEQKMDALRIAFHDISQPLSRAVQHRAEDYSLT
ncbi:intermediate conductance calcium-activated potassium channel protein 4-like [Acipenser oxyrinchus oxyrinchus]|uniref:Intermediate conductance calcium-activated potassium channel protein 4-like n=1 Tax=Acipenser oxyrinchus oxyrinchus TaxID=40147 RepID=A0AAD8FVL7_ACIOX|nr:intermediate conductance calcium-activated potassium channel protein 4-like [Acipenser oxyrinchus oxyrinchus]